MPIMSRYCAATLFGAVAISLAVPAYGQTACEADMPSLDFAQISVRDGLTPQTNGSVNITCTGGVPGATPQACLTIGSGSGGSAAGLAPRYLAGTGPAPLDYMLTSGDVMSAGGIKWDAVNFSLPANLTDGSSSARLTIYAEVTSIGALVTVGNYRSQFDPGANLAFSYGETACDRSGNVTAFAIAAQVMPSCAVTVSNMDFGMIDSMMISAIDQKAIITVSCTNDAAYTVGLDQGIHAIDTGRRMTSGADFLAYGLYRDQARTAGWDTSAQTIAATGTGGNQEIKVYGRLYVDQTAFVGAYSDTVVVVVSYGF